MPTVPASFSEALQHARRYRALGRIALDARKDPVIVFSLGKTGTTSIEAAIQKTGRPTQKVHRMTREGIRQHRYMFRPPGSPAQTHHVRGHYWRMHLAVDNSPRSFVCGVREPVARTISWFFQIGWEFGWFDRNPPSDAPLEPLRETFETFYGKALGWDFFDEEMRPSIGIDVYATPFPTDVGYQVYDDHHRMLLIRYEDISRVAETALQDFLQLDHPLPLPRSNAAADKGFATLYKRFKDEVRLSPWILDSAYASRIAQHFYTADERAAFRAHWEDR